ncbi:hypothetical protein ACVA51_11000 [Pseudomonas luteola]
MMKLDYHQVLEHIYKEEMVEAKKLFSMMRRKKGNHSDFFPLAALLKDGYIGYTGGYDPESKYCEVHLAEQFQAYSQGPGTQRYGNTTVLSGSDEQLYFYLAGKGIEYFHSRKSDRTRLLTAALLSLASALLVAFLSEPIKHYWPTSSNACQCPASQK